MPEVTGAFTIQCMYTFVLQPVRMWAVCAFTVCIYQNLPV